MPKLSPLRHLPLAFFSVVMGLCGFSLTLQKGAQLFGLSRLPGQLVAVLALAIYGVLLLAQAYRGWRYRHEVIKEINHPVKLSFLPAISISLLLLGLACQASLPALSQALIRLGVPLQLVLTLFVISRWINRDHFQVIHANPAWFIPAVGNILVPIAVVPLGWLETAWFFFSIGLIFWLVLLTLVMYRAIFHPHLPEKLLPTYAILLAPPAVGFMAYLQLSGGLDAFARISYHFSLFTALLLLCLLPRFIRLHFSLTWWAYSFPFAAFTLANMTRFKLENSLFFDLASRLCLSLICLLVPGLLLLTLRALVKGQLLVEE